MRKSIIEQMLELWIESESKYMSGNVSSTKVKVCLHNASGNVSIFVGLMK